MPKRMRFWLSAMVLVLALLPGAPTRAAGAEPSPRISREQARLTLRRYFPMPEMPGELLVSLTTGQGRNLWSFFYQVDSSVTGWGPGVTLGYMDAETGRLLDYDVIGLDRRTPPAGPLQTTEADERGEAWNIVGLFYPPQVTDSLVPMPEGTYSFGTRPAPWDVSVFTWAESHDGSPNLERMISVAIERGSLRHLGIHSTLDTPVTFSSQVAISAEEARLQLESIRPTLSWQPVYKFRPDRAADGGMAPVYGFDALPLTSGDGSAVPGYGGKQAAATGLQALPGCPAAPPAAPVTLEQAVARAGEILGAPLQKGQYDANRFVPGYWGVYTRNVPGKPDLQVTIDPATGNLLGLSRPIGPEPKELPDWEAVKARGLDAAFAVVRQYAAYACSELRYDPVSDRDGTSSYFRVTFHRYVQGLPVPSDQLSVTIDLGTWDWASIGATWSNATFPVMGNLISEDAARQVYLADRKPQLVWMEPPGTMMCLPPADGSWPPTGVQPYFRLWGRYTMVDARTGELIDQDGRTATFFRDLEQKLAGHPAEGELRFLLSDGALLPERLDPALPVQRLEALSLLLRYRPAVRAGNTRANVSYPFTDVPMADARSYQLLQAIRLGVLRSADGEAQFRPDSGLSRAEFALWTARALQLGPLARSNLTVGPVPATTGLTEEQQKAIAMLQALEVVPAYEYGAPLTQGDLALIIGKVIRYLMS